MRDRGSTIWLHSSSTTMSKRCPSSKGIPAEQQVTPTTAAVFSFFLRAFSTPALTYSHQRQTGGCIVHVLWQPVGPYLKVCQRVKPALLSW